MADKLLLTVNEACAALSCGRTFFYEMVRDGKIKTIKLAARKTLVARDELRRFAAELTASVEAAS